MMSGKELKMTALNISRDSYVEAGGNIPVTSKMLKNVFKNKKETNINKTG